MIPESAGATPYGIFELARSFDDAASLVRTQPALLLTHGPVRLLYYHACELYLKAYLRRHEWDVDRLRALNHDLSQMLDEAMAAGLKVAPQTVAQVRKLADKNDYVRVRYMVVDDRRSDIQPESLARLTADIRESVRPACIPKAPAA
jgi:hypothetical protein